MTRTPVKHYLLASDFDQTLSFKDSGIVLAELLGDIGVRGSALPGSPAAISCNRGASSLT